MTNYPKPFGSKRNAPSGNARDDSEAKAPRRSTRSAANVDKGNREHIEQSGIVTTRPAGDESEVHSGAAGRFRKRSRKVAREYGDGKRHGRSWSEVAQRGTCTVAGNSSAQQLY